MKDDILSEACADVAWSGSPLRLRANTKLFVSANGLMTGHKKLAQGDEKAVVLAGVRSGLYTITREGKKAVVEPTTHEQQEELK